MTWLVPEAQREQTPHRYAAGHRKSTPVELAVVHYTASPHSAKTQHGDDAGRMRRWLAGTGRESSTHFVATRAGEIIQAATLDERTWHSGGSMWRGVEKVNNRSIGLDLENVGYLDRDDGRWLDHYGGRYVGPEPFRHHDGKRYSWWEPYRVAQLSALFHVVGLLCEAFPVLRDGRDRFIGHEAIRRTKSDPGPAFPWLALEVVVDGGHVDWAALVATGQVVDA